MDAARWKLAREIFDSVVDLPPSERRIRVAAACGDDRALQEEVESLLAHDDPLDDAIEQAVGVAARDNTGEDAPLVSGQTILHYGLRAKVAWAWCGASMARP